MSDLIDDLLNYELGDVDDQELAADEDELLLSDEESPSTKVSEKQANILLDESEEWVSLELAKASVKENKKVENDTNSNEKTKVIHNNKKSQIINKKVDGNIDSSTEVTTTEIIKQRKNLVSKPKLNRAALKNNLIKSDEVTSSVQDTTDEKQSKEEIQELKESRKQLELQQFQEIDTPIPEEIPEVCASEIEEDVDERNERLNPKTAVERDFISDNSELGGPRPNNRGYPRGSRGHRGGRHFGPRVGQMYGQARQPFLLHQGNDMFHNPHPYHSVPGQMMGPPQNTMYNSGPPNDHPPNGPRMDSYRGPPPPNFRPHPSDMRLQGPPHLHQHPSMVPRPNEFNQMRMPNQQHDGGVRQSFRPFNPNIRPGGPHHPRFDQMRPRLPGPHTQFINQSQQPQSFMGPPHPGNLMVVRSTDHHLGGIHQSLPSVGMPSQPVLPRKILINPNFKRGVEAAKNQLMIDNLQFIGHRNAGGQQQMQQNDEELLRQQEAFITQNRMHIEKRRHERSPERERDYTPPRRDRRPYSREREHGGRNAYRGRTRRDGFDSKLQPKRRRSESLDRDNYGDKEKTEEEDEETRVYRLEIEKQKAQREKILREKEERRKRAAEDKSKDQLVDKKSAPPVDADAMQKLTPIVVKQSKIISLKKKTSSQDAVQKTIPTAKILPETKKTQDYRDAAMAVVKPVIKNKPSAFIIKNISDDESDLDEDALLADSPSPPPSQSHHHQQQPHQHQAALPVEASFRGRRVVLKAATDFQKVTNVHKTLSSSGSGDEKHKGIFDRLEKKISVNDASKRTIQRIVLNNTE